MNDTTGVNASAPSIDQVTRIDRPCLYRFDGTQWTNNEPIATSEGYRLYDIVTVKQTAKKRFPAGAKAKILMTATFGITNLLLL